MGSPLLAASFALAIVAACTGAGGAPLEATTAPAESRDAPAPVQGDSHGRRSLHAASPARRWLLLGRSADDRPIRVLEIDQVASRSRFVLVGCIHGDECAGTAIVRRLERATPDPAVDLWLLRNLNPDGLALGMRQNGRGVDLNRNFPSQWRPIGERWDAQYSGPRPLSEPETRIARRLILSTRPAVTIWYHQYWGREPFVRAWGGSIPAGRRYARLAGIRFRTLPWPAGTAPNWQNHRLPGTSSFVVEFPRGPLDPAAARRHARAVLALSAA